MGENEPKIPIGTKSLVFSKMYYCVLSKRLENLDIDRYFSVIYFISENSGCSQQYICNHLAIDKTAMVKVINYLIKADYVERKKNPDDRREQFIVLTEKGLKYSQDIIKVFQKMDEEIFKSVSKSDMEIYKKVLSSLILNLDQLPADNLTFDYKKSKSHD